MNNILYYVALLFCFATNAQTIEVHYQIQIDLSGGKSQPNLQQYHLTNSQGKSLQKKFLEKHSSENRDGSTSRFVKVGNDTTFIYKNFSTDRLISEERIFTKAFVVEDNLQLFKWTIEADTLTVLSQKCRKASTKFRGREYIAYFAEDIPIPDGPYKFNGLPGLILKVLMVNSESVFVAEAVSIRLNGTNKEIRNPFEGKKLTRYEDYKKEHKRKSSEMEAYSQQGDVKISSSGWELHDE